MEDKAIAGFITSMPTLIIINNDTSAITEVAVPKIPIAIELTPEPRMY